jgi:hypothetical protein
LSVILGFHASVVHAQQTTDPPYGKIAGVVYVDLNGNGVQDGGEPAVENVEIKVFRAGGFNFTVLTGPDGTYEVDKLIIGTYTVTGIPPGGYGIAPGFQQVIVADGATAIANFRLYPWVLWMPKISKQP